MSNRIEGSKEIVAIAYHKVIPSTDGCFLESGGILLLVDNLNHANRIYSIYNNRNCNLGRRYAKRKIE